MVASRSITAKTEEGRSFLREANGVRHGLEADRSLDQEYFWEFARCIMVCKGKKPCVRKSERDGWIVTG